MMANPEFHVHMAVLHYLQRVLPGAMVVHVPNQVDVSDPAVRRAVAKNRTMGMVPGFPDLMVLHASLGAPVFFEVKSASGRLRPEQAEVIERLRGMGYRCAVVRSIDDVKARLDEWREPANGL